MTYVVDASLAVKWYVPEIYEAEAARVLVPGNDLCAPGLIAPEFGNIIWKKVRRGEITSAKGRQIVEAFLAVPLLKYPSAPLLEVAFAGAEQTGQTVYDWTYLALAVSLNCQMVTADEKFYLALQSGAMGNHLLWVGDIP